MSEGKVTGVVHVIEETKTYGQKGFRKRLVVLEQDTGGRFQNLIPVEFIQDACDSVDGMNVGDEVEISYRLSGRKWQRDPDSEVKYFLSCEATSYRTTKSATDPAAEGGFSANANDDLAQAAYDDDDEVPF